MTPVPSLNVEEKKVVMVTSPISEVAEMQDVDMDTPTCRPDRATSRSPLQTDRGRARRREHLDRARSVSPQRRTEVKEEDNQGTRVQQSMNKYLTPGKKCVEVTPQLEANYSPRHRSSITAVEPRWTTSSQLEECHLTVVAVLPNL